MDADFSNFSFYFTIEFLLSTTMRLALVPSIEINIEIIY